MKTVVFANQKGGCGKTTSAQAFASGLLARGYKVLVIDADPQCNLTDLTGISEDAEGDTLRQLMKGDAYIESCITELSNGLDIVPGDLLLSGIDAELSGDIDAPYILRDALEDVSEVYDFVVIDTAPSLGLLTTGALVAADELVIPLTPDRFSIKGIEQLVSNVERIQRRANQKLHISGFLLTRCDHTKTTEENAALVAAQAADKGIKVFNSRIRQGVAVRAAQSSRADLFASGSNVAADYDNFINEFLEG